MNPIQFALAFIDTFNLKKLSVLVLFVIFAVGGLTLFEKFTSHFYLTRVDKGAQILEKVVKIREEHSLTSEEEAQRKNLLNSLEPPKAGWSFEMPEIRLAFRWDKFLLGGALWFIIGATMVLTQGRAKVRENLLATVLGAAFFGFVALLSPFDGFIMMAFVTPVVVMTFFVFVILAAVKVSSKKISEAEQGAAPNP